MNLLAGGLAGASIGNLLGGRDGAIVGGGLGALVGLSLSPNLSRRFAGPALGVAAVAGLIWLAMGPAAPQSDLITDSGGTA